MQKIKKIDSFSSKLAFILVTAGAAVGLGNIWAFPFVVGNNGGGAFFLLYLVVLLLIATPVFVAELLLGRMGEASPPNALKALSKTYNTRVSWQWIAWVGMIATLLILSYYSVIAGQAVAYGVKSMMGEWSNLTPGGVLAVDGAYKDTVGTPALWHTVFMVLTTFVVAQDIRQGIERAAKWLMPLLFILLLFMVLYSMTTAGFGEAFAFLFTFEAVDFTPSMFITSFGLAFFTLSIGVGGIMMFGAYMGKEVKLGNAVGWIVLMDLVVAVMAGLAIFPLVFTHGLDAAAGPGLVFQTLPIIFASIVGGGVLGAAFFLLLTVAALTSAVSLMAPAVQWLTEKGWSRKKAAVVIGLIIYLLGYVTVFSFNIWSDWYPLSFIEALDGATLFDLIREGVNIVILPLGGFVFALLVGWVIPREAVQKALAANNGIIFKIWHVSLRYIVPLAIIALFLSSFI